DPSARLTSPLAGHAEDHATLNGLYARAELPSGFHQVMLPDEGPVLTDAAGMTLYLWNSPRGGFCKNENEPLTDNLGPQRKSLAGTTATCAAQWPPLLAQDNAQSVGDWTLVKRPEGTRQWAYKGYPVHHSYKDQLPGDVNGITATEPRNPFTPKPGYFI